MPWYWWIPKVFILAGVTGMTIVWVHQFMSAHS